MNTNAQTDQADDARQWLTTSQAAAALGVAPKTIRRRIERGELEARKMPRDGGGVSWRVQIGGERDISRDSSTPTERTSQGTAQRPRKGQLNAHTERVKDILTPSERDSSTPMSFERNAHERDSSEDSDHMSDLRDEVKFLRGVIEQLQRDGAEVRAALRESLKQRAPQLTQGNAPEPRGAPHSAPITKDSPKDASGPQKPAKRDSTPLTYGDIADELEAQEKNR